ncbi:hypothetical protein [Falsirhodobacter sp. alg1]|uniref:hypothetical protein n=1 Tax=Falsirhodobacter sp. alg1 TaxID=1472418 RepID=UPI0005EE3F96|nr:hypothetical protein [Falsirhodobacter sp. alg1]
MKHLIASAIVLIMAGLWLPASASRHCGVAHTPNPVASMFGSNQGIDDTTSEPACYAIQNGATLCAVEFDTVSFDQTDEEDHGG